MKLVYVTASLPYGPGEAFFIPEILELRAAGHEVTVVPVRGRGEVLHREAKEIGAIEPHLMSAGIAAGAVREVLRQPLRVMRQLMGLMRTESLRGLVGNLAAFPKALWLVELARRDGIDHIHGCWASVAGTMAMVAGTLCDCPWSFSAHGWDIRQRNLMREKLRCTSFARFISQDGRAAAGAHAENAVVLHLGQMLPVPTFVPVAKRMRIFCVAGLIPLKGHRYLFEAAAILVSRGIDFKLRVAGSGGLRAELETLAKDLGIRDHVEFLGQRAHEEVIAEYARNDVDVTVLPSLHEGIPVSLMEAMAHGVPVVATAVGGTPELLRDGAGLLVPAKDPKALAEALTRITGDTELRWALSRAGRTRMEEEFDVHAIVAQLIALMAYTGVNKA